MQAAIAAWNAAVRGFDGQLAGCWSRANPTHDFFSFCIKHPPVEYRQAAARVRDEFGAACKQQAPRADVVLKRDLALLQREVDVGDRAINNAMKRRGRHGPPALAIQAQARAKVHRDLGELRRLAGDC
jgi:hypothetical protein